MHRLLLAFGVAMPAAMASTGCSRGEHEPGPPPAPSAMPALPIASVAQRLGFDAGALESPVDPAAPAGDLKAELDAFTTIDACVQLHAQVDPLVGDALETIGYDTFLRDACRVLDGAKAREAKRCEAIDASTLRTRCESTVAEIVGDADACPWEVSTRRTLGRSAACVAIALRDARLCAGVRESSSRATCEAIARHNSTACTRLPMRADQARCTRDEQRWHSATPTADANAVAFPTPVGKLRIEGGDAGAPIDTDLGVELARGLVIIEERNGARTIIGTLTDSGVGFLASSPHRLATLGVELFTLGGASGAKEAHIERAELVVPGHLPLATPTAGSTLRAKFDKLERVRGGAVTFSIDGTLSSGEGSWKVHAEGTTFVRDVIKGEALHDAALPRFGLDGGMR